MPLILHDDDLDVSRRIPQPSSSQTHARARHAAAFERARPAMTFMEVGRAVGVTHQAVIGIEKRALAKCRKWCAERGLRVEDLLG